MPPLAHQRRLESGYTLIELAIVIVIVGLLLGGILEGRSILDAAENRRIYTDAQDYISAIGQFSEKYGSLPGDMFDAETIWGQAAAGAACKATISQDKKTCGGDGDGHIELGETDGTTGVKTVEQFRAWQQLANASLIKGNLTGAPGAGGDNHAVVEVNVPKGVIDGSGYSLYYIGTGGGNFFTSPLPYNHILHFGQGTATGITDAPTLLPDEAWEVDVKVDDGIPHSGSVRTYTNTAQPNCATADDLTAVYNVTYTDGRACNLIFLTGF